MMPDVSADGSVGRAGVVAGLVLGVTAGVVVAAVGLDRAA